MTEELKEQIHERVYNIKVPTLGFSRRDLFNIAMEYAEPREKRIAELEKENAELKEDNSEWEKASDKWKSVYELTNNQLTKAKAILRGFVDWANWQGSNCPSFKSIQDKAEQFLKE